MTSRANECVYREGRAEESGGVGGRVGIRGEGQLKSSEEFRSRGENERKQAFCHREQRELSKIVD